MGAVVRLMERHPHLGVLAITSPDRLHAGWTKAQKARAGGSRGARAHVETLLADLPAGGVIVTVIDGHPATLSWLGGVGRHVIHALGVQSFGQSADLVDLFRVYGLDSNAIAAAATEALERPALGGGY
jgi:pyruvate dehydrogenase E1 component